MTHVNRTKLQTTNLALELAASGWFTCFCLQHTHSEGWKIGK